MSHVEIFDTFSGLDIDDNIKVQINNGQRQLWSIYEIHQEPEGLYVQYFPIASGAVELAFIPAQGACTITQVKKS